TSYPATPIPHPSIQPPPSIQPSPTDGRRTFCSECSVDSPAKPALGTCPTRRAPSDPAQPARGPSEPALVERTLHRAPSGFAFVADTIHRAPPEPALVASTIRRAPFDPAQPARAPFEP